MRQLTYRLSFLTPAFLGNAEQSAQCKRSAKSSFAFIG
jgi:hypothetical protein